MTSRTYISGVLQVKAYRALQSYVAKEIKKYGINPTQWFILGQINEIPSIRPADIAVSLKVEAPLITALTDDLSLMGLIDKLPSKTDKRVRHLVLTKKAKILIPKIEKDLNDRLEVLLKGVSSTELEAYKNVLELIIINSEQMNSQ